VTKPYAKRSADWRDRRTKRKQVRYLLLSLGLASLASAIVCLVLWNLSQPSGAKRTVDPFDLEQAAPIQPKR